MAKIDVKFMKGNKQTLSAMNTTYREKPKQTVRKAKTDDRKRSTK